jgi:hypothetical protein
MVRPNGPAPVMLLIFKGSSGMVMVNAIGGLGRSLEYGVCALRQPHRLVRHRSVEGRAAAGLRRWLRWPMWIAVERVGCGAKRFCVRRSSRPY